MVDTIQILFVRPSHRPRFTVERRRALLNFAAQAGSSLSEVARRYGISPSFLFLWKRAMDEGSEKGLEACEPVVPASVVKQLVARIRAFERALVQKTMHVEILEEAAKIARKKTDIGRVLPNKRGGQRPRLQKRYRFRALTCRLLRWPSVKSVQLTLCQTMSTR